MQKSACVKIEEEESLENKDFSFLYQLLALLICFGLEFELFSVFSGGFCSGVCN